MPASGDGLTSMPGADPRIDAIARHVERRYKRRAWHRRHWHNQLAVAEAVAQAIREALAALVQRIDRDEALVDLAHAERYTVGLRGVKVTLTLLVATNRRLWHVVHRDGAVVTLEPIPMDAVRAQRKGLIPSIGVERSAHDWMVTGTKSLVTWVDDMVRSRPQVPVGLLARITASSPVNLAARAAWLADPAGRHEFRYWDGTRWTEHVSDRGVTAQDPLS